MPTAYESTENMSNEALSPAETSSLATSFGGREDRQQNHDGWSQAP